MIPDRIAHDIERLLRYFTEEQVHRVLKRWAERTEEISIGHDNAQVQLTFRYAEGKPRSVRWNGDESL